VVARGLGAGVLILALAAGCVSTGPWLAPVNGPPTGTVCQVAATWNNKVLFAPDPTHGGAPTPGLAGRVYLFGPDLAHPLAGDGRLSVHLYDHGPTKAGGAPVALEEWHIDKDTLKKLLRKDLVGWGYTLFLPWGTYKPEITQVYLQLSYQPPTGPPLQANGAPVTLDHEGVSNFQVVARNPAPAGPAAGPAAPAGPQVVKQVVPARP
jgi:hypothetical protein